jgi:hypothetical protein
MHIAPELHREANRVSNSVLVAELHFGKQVATPFPPPPLPLSHNSRLFVPNVTPALAGLLQLSAGLLRRR